MGWLFPYGATRRQLIGDLTKPWESHNGDVLIKSACLNHCYRGGSFSGVLWSVWERTFTTAEQESAPPHRWIGCDLLEYRRAEEGWGYKDLDESCGPCHFSCPLKYLDLVPLDKFGGNAEWREAVRAYHQHQAEKRRKRRALLGS